MTIRSITIALLTAVSMGMASGAVAAEFELTYSTTYSPTHPYGQADEMWIQRI